MKRTRSPNYPIIDLETAVGLVETIYQYAQRHPVPATAAAEKWGLKADGSQASQYIAALRAFGLVAVDGMKDQRKIRVTEDGAKIVLKHPDRYRLLREAALRPKIHEEVWGQADESGLPPDETLRNFLLWEIEPRFNPNAVEPFLRQFRRTIAFSGLDFTSHGPVEYDGAEETKRSEQETDKREPRVTEVAAPTLRQGAAGQRQEVFSLDEGTVVLEWPSHLSKESAADLESWLELVLRKVKRSVSVTVPSIQTDSDSDEDLVG